MVDHRDAGGRAPAPPGRAQIAEFGMTPASDAARSSVPIRLRLTRLDGR